MNLLVPYNTEFLILLVDFIRFTLMPGLTSVRVQMIWYTVAT
jgi:hypothetical protein